MPAFLHAKDIMFMNSIKYKPCWQYNTIFSTGLTVSEVLVFRMNRFFRIIWNSTPYIFKVSDKGNNVKSQSIHRFISVCEYLNKIIKT